MNARSLDDIIAKAIPMLPGDCKRSKSKKEWMREEAKKRIIQWAANELMAWSMNNALSKASAMGIDALSPLPIDPDLKAAIDESRNDKDLMKGGTVNGDTIAMVGDDPNRREMHDTPEDRHLAVYPGFTGWITREVEIPKFIKSNDTPPTT